MCYEVLRLLYVTQQLASELGQFAAGRFEGKAYTFPLLDAINRRNEQPTTVNIIFCSP